MRKFTILKSKYKKVATFLSIYVEIETTYTWFRWSKEDKRKNKGSKPARPNIYYMCVNGTGFVIGT